jgi:folate-binding protein YgfZ
MPDTRLPEGLAELPDWGLIRARGEDAASFLQGQLTNDVAMLGAGEARLAGYCSPKGRLLASFVVWKSGPDEMLLACSKDLLAATLKRLSMFVLRARCKLSDASGELAVRGLAGRPGDEWLGGAAPTAPWKKTEHAGHHVVRLPDAAGSRHLLVSPVSALAPGLPALRHDDWRWLEVESGVPRIEAATVDQFVPQMINLELIGGVDFRKGCYPGQEVVARSQYRGTLKRRMALFDCDGMAQTGQEVFHSDDAQQPAGMVVNAAPRPDGGCSALVEVKLAALDGGSLHLGGVEGPVMIRRALPYAVPAAAVA